MSLRIYGPVGSDGGSIPTTPGDSTPGTGGTGGTGSSGPQSFTHTQVVPALVWRFAHDLPFDPAGMRITDVDHPGDEWQVAEEYDAPSKTYTLRFPVPVRGTVTVS